MTTPAGGALTEGVAVIADIVGSRRLPDRAGAQEAILAAFARAEEAVPALRPAWASVGDEFQAVHASWQDAARAVLRVALHLPEGVALRFGLGEGPRTELPAPAGQTPIQDGPAWIRAREALTVAESRAPGPSTAYRGPDPALTAAVDGQLLLRDHVVGRLRVRERRLAAALLDGATQTEAARAERITQSAVSQAVARSGIDRLLRLDALHAEGADR